MQQVLETGQGEDQEEDYGSGQGESDDTGAFCTQEQEKASL